MRSSTALPALAAILIPALAFAQDADRIMAEAISSEGGFEAETQLADRLMTVQEAREEFGLGRQSLAGAAGFLTTNQDPEGDMPRDLCFTADGSEVVIANRDTDTVTFFDAASMTVTHSVAVGDFPVDVCVTPDNQYAIVPNVFSNSVTVIDVATHSVAGTVPITGAEPYTVAVTSDSAFAVVGVVNDAVSSAVSVIDLSSLTEVNTFGTVSQGVFGFFFTPEPGISGNIFSQFALSSDDTSLVLPDRFNDRIAVYDISNGSETLLASAALPTSVDISPDGLLAVVAHEGSTRVISTVDLSGPTLTNSFLTTNDMGNQVVRVTHDKTHAIASILNAVQFVNLSSGAVTAVISTGTSGDIGISFDGQYAFVANFNARVIDIATQTQVNVLTYGPSYDTAISPVSMRAAALNNRFREDVHLYDIDGASGSFLGAALTGEIEEGDAPRSLDISGDGTLAVVAQNTSNNVAVVDLTGPSVRSYIPTGARSLGVAVSADGTVGVVANASSNTLSVLDLTTDTTVASLSVPQSPAEVAISPDGTRAYVTTLAGTDKLYFIDLNGASSMVTGSLNTGQMGSIGYTYGVFSGMTLSPDGATLALCISFDDRLMIVDTASQSELARVPVGDFPIRAAFSPDSSRIYVTHSFGDNLMVVSNAGAGSTVLGTVSNIEFPLHVSVDDADQFSYVGSWDFTNPSLRVIDNTSISEIASLPLDSRPRSQVLVGSDLYLTLTDGELVHIDASGASSSLIESVDLAGSPSDMAYSAALHTAVCAEPGPLDGLDLVDIGGPANYCSANANSSGLPASIGSSGSLSIASNDFHLTVSSSAFNQPGLFYYGGNQIQVTFGNGFRCVGAPLFRLNPPLAADATGFVMRQLDFTAPPANGGPGEITPASTWNFQWWHRDPMGGGALFNLSDGLAVTFAP